MDVTLLNRYIAGEEQNEFKIGKKAFKTQSQWSILDQINNKESWKDKSQLKNNVAQSRENIFKFHVMLLKLVHCV